MSSNEVEVVAAVVIQGSTVLAVERAEDFMKGRIDLPAGHVNPGEDRREAAIRETREETGYDVSVAEEPFGEVSIEIESAIYHTYLFEAHITGGTPTLQEEEVARILWVEPHVLLESAVEHGVPRYTVEPIISKISALVQNRLGVEGDVPIT